MGNFKDFIGNEIKIGSFCAYPGAGNVKAEYGTILYKITGFDEAKNKIKAVRLHAEYGQNVGGEMQFHPSFLKNAIMSPSENMLVRFAIGTIENFNKLAVVNVPQNIQDIFNKVLEGDKTVFDLISAKNLGYWIHGSTHSPNPFV
jgi:hypothetical protein